MQCESKLVCRDEQEAHCGLNMKSLSWASALGTKLVVLIWEVMLGWQRWITGWRHKGAAWYGFQILLSASWCGCTFHHVKCSATSPADLNAAVHTHPTATPTPLTLNYYWQHLMWMKVSIPATSWWLVLYICLHETDHKVLWKEVVCRHHELEQKKGWGYQWRESKGVRVCMNHL